MKTILHVDINSYFATLLQQENPHLRGQPIGVVKDIGRTCIIAASKEAKLHGVKTGTTTSDAQQRCPTIQFLAAEFDRYLAATQALSALFHRLCPTIYIYSLDEAFLNITDCQSYLYPDPHQFAQHVQQAIRDTLGEWVTCNVGISYNFLLAKLASEISPKGSVKTIDKSNLDSTLASVNFGDVCGVGFRLERKLQALHVTHPYQIRFLDPDELELWVGPFWQKELFKIAYGQETHHFELLQNTNRHPELTSDSEVTLSRSNRDQGPIGNIDSKHPGSSNSMNTPTPISYQQPSPQMKTVSRSVTTWQLVNDEDTIRQILLNLSIEVAYKARQMSLSGRQIGIFLSGRTDKSRTTYQNHKHLEEHQFLHLQRFGERQDQSSQISSTSWIANQIGDSDRSPSLQSKNCVRNNSDGSFSTHLTLKHPIHHTSEYFQYLYHHLYLNWCRSFPIIKFGVYLGLLQSIDLTPASLLPTWQKQEKTTLATDAVNHRYGLFTLRPASLLNTNIIRPEVTGFLGDKTFWGV